MPAIGAGRARLVGQRLAESLILAAAGGIGGVLFASWAVSALATTLATVLPVSLDIRPDGRVLAFALGVSVATALACGLLPALHAARVDPLPALKAGGQPGRDRRPLGRALVVVQVAISLVLLVGAGLFVRSLANLERIDTGFDPSRVLLLGVSASAGTTPLTIDERRQLFEDLLMRADAVPGVAGASASSTGLWSGGAWRNAISIDGIQTERGVTLRSLANAVSPRYFEVMRLAILRGRSFTANDAAAAPRVALVSQTFARQYFGAATPLGRRIGLCSSVPCGELPAERRYEIVGVVEDAKYVDLTEEPTAMLYIPVAQAEQTIREVQIRTVDETSTIAAALHRTLSEGDRRLAVVTMTDAQAHVDRSLAAERLIARLSALFGALALAMAAVGLYGLVTCVTVQRTGEIGIRMALGASRADVRGLVLRDTVTLLAVGTAIGLPAAWLLSRLLDGQLHGVPSADPVSFVIGVATLGAAALVAGLVPAVRASRVDPVRALRSE